MHKVNLREDAVKVEKTLIAFLDKLKKRPPQTLSAIAIGFECDQSGWFMFVADQRQEHERDGECFDEDGLIAMPHWNVVNIAGDQGKHIEVTKVDGSTFNIAPFEESGDDEPEDSDDEMGPPFSIAIGEMILHVLTTARKNGLFKDLSRFGNVQLDIEDFNGGWAWPEYDELGKSNLA